jgi:hypothetical protein
VSHDKLGIVEGLSCAGAGGDLSHSEQTAVEQVKIKAVKLGANAITTPVCQHKSRVDWGNNCFGSHVCVSDALLIERPAHPADAEPPKRQPDR